MADAAASKPPRVVRPPAAGPPAPAVPWRVLVATASVIVLVLVVRNVVVSSAGVLGWAIASIVAAVLLSPLVSLLDRVLPPRPGDHPRLPRGGRHRYRGTLVVRDPAPGPDRLPGRTPRPTSPRGSRIAATVSVRWPARSASSTGSVNSPNACRTTSARRAMPSSMRHARCRPTWCASSSPSSSCSTARGSSPPDSSGPRPTGANATARSSAVRPVRRRSRSVPRWPVRSSSAS